MLKKFLSSLFSRPQEAAPSEAWPSGVPNPGVRIVDGKVVPNYACQTDIVDHCNLACRDCNHASPAAPKGYANPDTLLRDFSMLAKVYQPRLVQIMGGEPLLHRDIVACMRAVKASGISDRLLVNTNGLLLGRMKDDFWETATDIEISAYPGAEPDEKKAAEYRAKARDFGVKLDIYHYADFRRTVTSLGGEPALVQRIFNACRIAHVWGCHAICDGYIYRCPQSRFTPRILGLAPETARRDGLRLHDGPGLRDELFAFLTAREPLQACRHCLATAGVTRPLIQVRPRDWLSHQEGAYADLVDFEELARLEADMHMQRPDHIKELVAGEVARIA